LKRSHAGNRDRESALTGEGLGQRPTAISEQEREPMAMTIRHAGPGDEPSVVELIQELAVAVDYPTTIDEHYVRHFLASPVSDMLLAIDDGEPVGLLSYAIVPGLFHAADSGLIESLVVAEGRRSEGIGRQLLTAAIKLLEDEKCSEISISTGADDEAVQKLYFEVGLTEASVLLEKHVDK
jgi:ribosomal protein S18 acetylase RimI-like enzyme